MAKPATILRNIKKAVGDVKTEQAAVNAVARELALYGYIGEAAIYKGSDGRGGIVRVYVFEDTPAGSFVLVSGPSIISEIQTISGPAAKSLEAAGVYIKASSAGRVGKRIASKGKSTGAKTMKRTEPAPAKKPRKKTSRKTSRKKKMPPKVTELLALVDQFGPMDAIPSLVQVLRKEGLQDWMMEDIDEVLAHARATVANNKRQAAPPGRPGGSAPAASAAAPDAAALMAMFKSAAADVIGGL